ncbi:biotin synthase BioB [Pseudodesulfovibrio tunisiensis]|uniref:biotin synthase BioB n=1 Tax=Pseudodesulfovibrio tunisiensis TaxID=463192 RepID=UPI001FB52027|nr:biotin synthase BioB [Pseudodesulfovibrio tunisiensis]
MILESARRKALEGKPLSDAEIRHIIDPHGALLPDLLEAAHAVRSARFGNGISLCAIVNAKSGRCSEDCAFCAQSGHHHTRAPEYPLLPVEEIAAAGQRAFDHGAAHFGVVASGKLVGGHDLDEYAEAVKRLARIGLKPDLSPGILAEDQLAMLKKAGLVGYHHNLETSASFFPSICTTHAYDEDVRAVRSGIRAGLYVCSGGIFGIGESWEDRVELALLLRELGVPSVPMNFLHPIPGTRLENRPVLAPEEALRIVAVYRLLLPDAALRICGGRLTVFGEARKAELLHAGASGLMVGDYLTTSGASVDSDLGEIAGAGLVPA